jgi:hypothetical protein
LTAWRSLIDIQADPWGLTGLTSIPKYKTRPTKAARHFRFIPHGEGRGQLDALEPGELIFVGNIELDFKTRGGKKHMLPMLDVATGGLRVKGFKHKHEAGEYFDEYIVEESLHKRGIRVTVGADGDGAMSLIKDMRRASGAWRSCPSRHTHLT